MKEENLILLAGIGIVGYGLIKSDFFKGVGEVGTGVGEAVGGLGSGISAIGKEAGDIVVDVGSVVEPLAAVFDRAASSIRREGVQSGIIDTAAFAYSKDAIAKIQGESDINTAQNKSLRKEAIQGQATQTIQFLTSIDDKVASAAKSLRSSVSSVSQKAGNIILPTIKASPVSVATQIVKSPEIRNKVSSTISTAVNTAKSAVSNAAGAVSSFFKKLRK